MKNKTIFKQLIYNQLLIVLFLCIFQYVYIFLDRHFISVLCEKDIKGGGYYTDLINYHHKKYLYCIKSLVFNKYKIVVLIKS